MSIPTIVKDPFVTAVKYLVDNMAFYVSYYVVVGAKIIELKNARFSFGRDGFMVAGDLDVDEGGRLNRLVINIYDRDNNLIASEDVRFEYDIAPGRYRLVFAAQLSRPIGAVRAPKCEAIAEPRTFLVKHPDFKVPVMYAGLHRMYDVESVYTQIDTVNASFIVIGSHGMPYGFLGAYQYPTYYTGVLGKLRLRFASKIGPVDLGGGSPATEENYHASISGGVHYVIRIGNTAVGIGKSDECIYNYNTFLQLHALNFPGLYDIMTTIGPYKDMYTYDFLVFKVGDCLESVAVFDADKIWMFGGAEVEVRTDKGQYRVRIPSLFILYSGEFGSDFCDSLGTGSKYALCGSVPSVRSQIEYVDVLGKIRLLMNNALVASKYVNHPCVQYWLSVGKQYEVLSIQSFAPKPDFHPDNHSPFFKLGVLLKAFNDPKSRVYTIYAPIYTAGLSKLTIFFRGRISVYFIDPPEYDKPPLATMYATTSRYWYSYRKPLISKSGGSATTDEKITVTIPKTYKGIVPLVIEYAPYYYSKSEISEELYERDVYCVPVSDYDKTKVRCYNYQCMRDEVVTTLYEAGTAYIEELIVSLEDESRSYIPTVRGSIVYTTPAERPPNNLWYSSIVNSIYSEGGHIDKSVERVPHIVVNPRYEFLTKLL